MNDSTINNHEEEDNVEFDDDYLPQFSPLWERLIGPGAIGASVVALILAICAMIITYSDPPMQITVFKKTPAVEVIDKPDEPELTIEEKIEIPVDTVTDTIIADVILAEIEETNNDEDFKEAKGEPDEVSRVDFDSKSFSQTIGASGNPGGIKGNKRGSRLNTIKGIGATRKTESAVFAALDWLRRHQSKNGMWDLESYTNTCGTEKKKGRCAGDGNAAFNIGGSAASLLAFTGHGLDHLVSSKYKTTITKSMNYLKSQQKNDGCFGNPVGEHLYNQSIATFALADLLMMSDDNKALKSSIEKGIEYLLDAQNDNEGGAWRYNNYRIHPEARSEADGLINDTSVTTWVVMALKTADSCGIKVDPKGFQGASKWLDSCYNEEKDGKYEKVGTFAYTMDSAGKHIKVNNRFFAPTACGVLSRQFMKQSKGVLPGANTMIQSLPDWDGVRDMYYWYYGSMAMFQVQGDHWEQWNEAMKNALTKNQHNKRSLCLHGSWDPEETVWGADYGGRIYTTAMGALTLEVYYKYGVIDPKKTQ